MAVNFRSSSIAEAEFRPASMHLDQAQAVALVVERLNELQPLKSTESESWLERQGEHLSKILMGLAVVLFFALSVLAAVKFFGAMPPSWISGALVLAAGSAGFALLSMAVKLLVGLVTIAMFQAYSARTRVLECARDYSNASSLLPLDPEILRDADRWLALKQKMIEQRLVFFFGGSEKLALFAIVGFGWIVWKEVSADLTNWKLSPTLMGVCFMAGLALGGMLNRIVLGRIEYQRGLIALALRVDSAAARCSRLAG